MGDVVTIILATVGTVLGCVNTVVLLNNRRVRLKVVPQSFVLAGDGVWSDRTKHVAGADACIEVINLSQFPVTITEVGYTMPSHKRLSITKPSLFDGKGWPRKLEPRDSVSVYTDVSEIPAGVGKSFARTACGVTRFGSSPALEHLKALLREGGNR
jgi:hypothetical protein